MKILLRLLGPLFIPLLLLMALGAHAQLPLTTQALLLDKKIYQAIESEDYSAAADLFAERRGVDIPVPPVLLIEMAKVHYFIGDYFAAHARLTEYLKDAPPDSPNYDTALDMYVELEAKPEIKEQAEAAAAEKAALQAAVAKLTPKCNEPTKDDDAACYIKVANHANCYRWNPNPADNESYEWSGQCNNGRPDGHGEETWRWSGGESGGTGSFRDGKRHGDWVDRFADGTVDEGPFVDGKRHGHWVVRYSGGDEHEGPYRNGERHGRWVLRLANGDVKEGPYRNGNKHGDWVERVTASGSRRVDKGPYVDGEKHGHWVWRYDGGTVIEGPYRNGEAHGRWIRINPDGKEDCRRFVNGKGKDWWKRRRPWRKC